MMNCLAGCPDSEIGTLNSDEAKNSCLAASLRVSGAEVEVTAESAGQPTLDVLSEGGVFLKELHDFLLQTAEVYRAGDDAKGRELFMELIQGMEWFVKMLSMVESQLQIDFSATSCAGPTIAASVESLNQILLEIIVAQEQLDLVLLTDLLEYELAPQLVLWLEIFTTLKQNRDAGTIGEPLPS